MAELFSFGESMGLDVSLPKSNVSPSNQFEYYHTSVYVYHFKNLLVQPSNPSVWLENLIQKMFDPSLFLCTECLSHCITKTDLKPWMEIKDYSDVFNPKSDVGVLKPELQA